jgi:hypothetical protein
MVENVIKLGRHVACVLVRVEKYTDTEESAHLGNLEVVGA